MDLKTDVQAKLSLFCSFAATRRAKVEKQLFWFSTKKIYIRGTYAKVLNKSRLIEALAGTEQPRRLIVDEQTDVHIIREVVKAHKENATDYDRISHFFAGGDIWDVCERLWTFCRENLFYKVESKQVQNVGCPIWILRADTIDCKNYACFIAGVLDSLKRQGLKVVWEFRFISDRPFSVFDRKADHVFVVVNPNTDDIWLDPVCQEFNEHIYYFFRTSRRVRTGSTPAAVGYRISSRVGAIGGLGCNCGGDQIGMSAVESQLLADVLSYARGLSGAMQQTFKTNTFNVISESVLKGVAIGVFGPVGAAALAALKLGAVALDKEFGVGSAGARVLTDLSNLNISGLISDVFSGRTYETDQYWAAVYYQFYVLGNNITSINFVSDSMVLPALKWFVDKSGVYISGREHIIALTHSASEYEALHQVNGDTTTDMTLVNAATIVGQRYWKNVGRFTAADKGSWANTIGVYDTGLVKLAASYGESPEQLALQTGTTDANAAAYTAAATESPVMAFLTGKTILPGVPNALIIAGGVGILIFVLSSNKN